MELYQISFAVSAIDFKQKWVKTRNWVKNQLKLERVDWD